MPVWALALLLAVTVLAGATGGQAAVTMRERSQSHGQHSAANAESPVAETLSRASRGEGPPPGWQPPDAADTAELPAVTVDTSAQEWVPPPREVIARVLAGLRRG